MLKLHIIKLFLFIYLFTFLYLLNINYIMFYKKNEKLIKNKTTL